MRKSLLTALCMTVAAAPQLALAQQGGDDQTTEDQGTQGNSENMGQENEGAEVVDQKQGGDHVKMNKDAKETAPGEVHTVVKG
ncbi:MAG: hypothetical protein ACJ790_05270, partial [Myxococcaceae bacterium]